MKSWHVLLAALWWHGVTCAATGNVAPPPTLTLEQIRERVAAARQAINAIDVTFTIEMVSEAQTEALRWQRQRVVITGAGLRAEHRFRAQTAGVETEHSFICTWNGAKNVLLQEKTRLVVVTHEPDLGRLLSHDWFDAALLFPKSPLDRPNSYDLGAVLSSPHARLKPELEQVGALWRHVVEHMLPLGKDGQCLKVEPGIPGVSLRIWLDPERGFMPVRIDHLTKNNQPFTIRWETERAQHVSEGLWLPLVATKRVAAAVMQTEGDVVYRMSVARDGDRPMLRVNPDPDAALFDASKNLPAGAQILDRRPQKAG